MTTFLLIFVGTVLLAFAVVVFYGAPYVPSRRRYIDEAFDELYKLGPKDLLVDLGSGDGVVLRQASSKGARAVGYELNFILVLISRLLSFGDRKVKVKHGNYWHTNFPEGTTIVYIFSVSRDADKLLRLLQSQADSLNKNIKAICYGSQLDKRPERTFKAYALYSFKPLQSDKA